MQVENDGEPMFGMLSQNFPEVVNGPVPGTEEIVYNPAKAFPLSLKLLIEKGFLRDTGKTYQATALICVRRRTHCARDGNEGHESWNLCYCTIICCHVCIAISYTYSVNGGPSDDLMAFLPRPWLGLQVHLSMMYVVCLAGRRVDQNFYTGLPVVEVLF